MHPPVSFVSLAATIDTYSNPLLVTSPQQGPHFAQKRSYLFRIFSHIIHHTCFDIAKNSESVAIKATKFLSELSTPITQKEAIELRSLIKTLKITTTFICKVQQRHQKRSLTTQRIQSCIYIATHCLAGHQNCSPIQVFLENGINEEAYSELCTFPIPENISKDSLVPVLNICIEKQNYPLALSLISFGVPAHTLSQPHTKELLSIALQHFDDSTVLKLIQSPCPLNDQDRKTLFLQTSHKGLFQSTRELLEQKKFTDAKDAHGNTALHHAFLAGNLEICSLLEAHISHTEINSFGQTPISTLFNIQQGNRDLVQISKKQERLSFIKKYLKLPPNPQWSTQYTERLSSLIGMEIRTPFGDAIELAFLFNDDALKKALFSMIFREDFAETCQELEKKYKDIEKFFFSSFSINKKHLETGCSQCEAPTTVPGNPSAHELLDSFNLINWKNSHQKEYVDPIQFLQTIAPFTKQLPPTQAVDILRERLKNFVDKAIGLRHLGYSPMGKAKKVFFESLQKELCHIAAKFKAGKPLTTKLETFKEFIKASPYCAGRFRQVCYDQFLNVYHEIQPTPLRKFQETLAECRKNILLTIITDRYKDEPTHHFNRAMKSLGKELGIPGHQIYQSYEEPLGRLNIEETKNSFYQAYSPHTLCVEWLFPALPKLRDAYVDLQKEFIPKWWEQEKCDKMRDSKEIEEERKHDYLSRYVHDEPSGAFKIEALVYLLEKTQIIISTIKWRDSKKEVTPIGAIHLYKQLEHSLLAWAASLFS